MTNVISNLSGNSISIGIVTKSGYLFDTQTVNLNAYAGGGMGHLTKNGFVFLGQDSLPASGQRWPSGV